MNDLLIYLDNDSLHSSQMHIRQCEFGRWLDHGVMDIISKVDPSFDVDAIHQHIHNLGDGLVALKHAGQTENLRERRDAFVDLSKFLLAKLAAVY